MITQNQVFLSFIRAQSHFSFPENNEETEILVLSQSLGIICVLTQLLGGIFLVDFLQVTGGFSYLLRLPVLRDCTGPHSSLPALGTAEGVLHTHTHNIHTSRFKVLSDRMFEGKSKEDGFLAATPR